MSISPLWSSPSWLIGLSLTSRLWMSWSGFGIPSVWEGCWITENQDRMQCHESDANIMKRLYVFYRGIPERKAAIGSRGNHGKPFNVFLILLLFFFILSVFSCSQCFFAVFCVFAGFLAFLFPLPKAAPLDKGLQNLQFHAKHGEGCHSSLVSFFCVIYDFRSLHPFFFKHP